MQKAKKRVFSVTAVLLAVLVALTALLPTAGAAQAATMRSKYTGKSYTHNARFNKLEVLNGVDISAWQEKVNWKKIKNDGIDFAILRAGYGKKANQEDAYFATNFKNASAAGLPVGILMPRAWRMWKKRRACACKCWAAAPWICRCFMT